MKRSRELTPLSHDHHQALFVAMQLKRAENQSAARAFMDFIDGSGDQHFRIEETILLPGWLAADPGADRAAAARVLAEHLDLRTAAARMQSQPLSTDELHALGELLEAHVRLEERELFPMIEEGLGEDALKALGEEIVAAKGR